MKLSSLEIAVILSTALLAFVNSEEFDIENHPAFRSDEIPTSFNNTLRVAAFNIQVFGVSKMGKPDVVACLKQVKKLK